MLVTVVETLAGDLRELTSAVEAGWREGVGCAGVDRPVCSCGVVACGVKGLAVVEEAFVVAVPWVGFAGEGVGCVGRSLVVAVDLLRVNSNPNTLAYKS